MGISQELFFYKLENSGPTHPKKIYFFLIFLFDNYLYSVNLWDMYNSNRKDIKWVEYEWIPNLEIRF